jgi:RNA polymerase sigma-54 factor
MSLAPRLDIRQSQSLVMTPQLQQAIKLLALSNLEIEGFIAEEVERNPLLEASAAEDSPDLSDAPDRESAPEVRDERVAADELVAGTGPGD